jgi:DUF1365 family protein
MMYLALDEVESINSRLRLFSKNCLSPYAFHPEDHLPNTSPTITPKSLALLENRVIQFAARYGIKEEIKYIHLLTNVRFLGYVFNPVSFFFCFDNNRKPICCLAEVGNTFGEKKIYFLKSSNDGFFRDRLPKLFYISPFTELNQELLFDLSTPTKTLDIKINTVAGKEAVVSTSVTGKQLAMNDKNLLKLTLRYPWAPAQVIILIHFHALLLWLKGTPFHMKEEGVDQQTEVLNPHYSLKKILKGNLENANKN